MAVQKVIWKNIVGILLNSCFLFIGIQSLSAQAPTWNLVLDGTVSSQNDKTKMAGVSITVLRNGSRSDQVTSDAKGKFHIVLPPDAKYLLEFSYSGYVTKRIGFSTKLVPPEFAEGGDFPFPFDITLFKEMPGLDVSILSKPLAEVAFDPTAQTITYNKEYTKSVQAQMEKLQADLVAQLAAQEAASKELEKNYQKSMADGAKAMTASDFASAKVAFAAALALKPGDASAKSKMDEAQLKYEKDLAGKQTEKAYKEAIENAEMALHDDNLKLAETEFQKALDAKAGDIYARDQLKEVRDKLAASAKSEQAYIAAIGKADAALAVKDYLTAKAEYAKASAAKPEDKYAKDQLLFVEELLVADAKKESEYIKAIERGETSLESKDYEAAKSAFEQASSIKPEEKYPKEQVTKINGLLAEIALKAKSYQDAIKRGDDVFAKNDLVNARKAYEEAVNINPVQQYPKDQIAAINKKTEEMALLESQYAEIIKGADDRYTNKDFISAKAEYTRALAIKSNEAHPKARIQEITLLLEKEAKAEEAYKAALSNADNAFKAKDYNSAKFEYEAASKIKPDEAYPKDQLGKIALLLAELAKKDEDFNKPVADGDAKFKSGQFDAAKQSYVAASALKPEESYPKEQMKIIDAKILELANLNKQYTDAITSADQLFNAGKLQEAKPVYEKALDIKPTETYPKEKIAAITASLAEAQKKDEQFNNLIKQGDDAFGKKDYSAAKTAFTSALAIKAGEKYPQDKVTEIDGILTRMAEDQKKYTDLIAKADAAFKGNDYVTALPLYREAAGLNESEPYPVNQITLIETRMADIKKADEAYALAIGKAESAEKAGDLNAALTEFKNASSIKPDEKYPKDKINSLTASIAENQKKDSEYTEAINLADLSKKSAEYDIALTQYKKASELKPAEVYPKNQIKEVEALKAASLAAIALAKKQDDDFKALIAEADAMFDKLLYEDSKKKYQAALDIKPTEAYPKTRIAEIDKSLASLMAEQERNNKYAAMITAGDKAFTAKDWSVARSSYQEAMAVKSNESYPAERIKAIEAAIAEENALASQKEIEAKYNASVTAADKAFAAKDWDNARSNYQQAKSVKPNETYPDQQLKAIDVANAEALALASQQEKEAAEKERQAKYTAFIAAGDKAFTAKDWENARSNFQQAKSVKPEETYPDQKLKAIDAAIAEAAALASQQEKEAAEKERQTKYLAFVASGDKAFKSKDWENARSNFQQAKSVKPEETYPDEQLKAIDVAIAESAALASQQEKEAAEKEKQAKYVAFVAAADKAFTAKDWENAASNYRQAKSVKPDETYPDQQLKAIEDAKIASAGLAAKQAQEAAEREKEEKYLSLIAAADKAFASKQWENANGNYKEALNVKPNESYPAAQLKLIEAELSAQGEGAKRSQYDAYISTADKAFKSKDWSSARSNYESAIQILPTEQYPKDQLKRLEEALAKEESISLQSKQDENYRQIIGDADQLFSNKDWLASQSKYREALEIKPSEVHPKNRLTEIEKNLAAEAEMAKKGGEYQNLINLADGAFAKKDYSSAKSNYSKALALKDDAYPKSKIKEIDSILEAEKAAALAAKSGESENQKKYDNLISEGDKNFSAKNYSSAKSSYQSALAVKPSESYPKNKISEIENILKNQQPVAAQTPTKKSSGLSDAEIAAMMSKWQDERNQAKSDWLNQYQTDLKETKDERVEGSDQRRSETNENLDNLEEEISKSNQSGRDRNLEEAKLVEEFRSDEQKQRQDLMKDAESSRNDVYDDIVKTEAGQKEMKETGNELYQVNTELKTTEKIELIREQQTRSKEAHEALVVTHGDIVELEEDIRQDKSNRKDHHMNEVERIRKDNELVTASVHTWTDESRESRSENYDNIVKLEGDIREFKEENGQSYKTNTESYFKTTEELAEYRDQKNTESKNARTKAYNDITDYQDEVAEITQEKHNAYAQNNEVIEKNNRDILDNQARMAADADERRMKFDRDFYTGEKKPRYPEVAREYSQGVTEESFEEDDAYVIKRIVVSGENIDEYQKVFYKWGGVFYKKNGRDVTEVIWNTETQ